MQSEPARWQQLLSEDVLASEQVGQRWVVPAIPGTGSRVSCLLRLGCLEGGFTDRGTEKVLCVWKKYTSTTFHFPLWQTVFRSHAETQTRGSRERSLCSPLTCQKDISLHVWELDWSLVGVFKFSQGGSEVSFSFKCPILRMTREEDPQCCVGKTVQCSPGLPQGFCVRGCKVTSLLS